MSTYILKKDCPFTDNSFGKSRILEQGTEFTFDNVNLYTNSKTYDGYFTKDFVENNTDWFEKKEEPGKGIFGPGERALGGKTFVYDPIFPNVPVSESGRAFFHALALENNQPPDQLTFLERQHIKEKSTHFLKSRPLVFVDAFQIRAMKDNMFGSYKYKELLSSAFLTRQKQKWHQAGEDFIKENSVMIGGFIVSTIGVNRENAYFSEAEFNLLFEVIRG